MGDASEGECERCGAVGPGRARWMFYRWHERFPESPSAKEFFCDRCLRIMRVYSLIAAAIGVIVIGGNVYLTIRVIGAVPGP